MSELINEIDGKKGYILKIYTDKCELYKSTLFSNSKLKEFYYTDIISLDKGGNIACGGLTFETAANHGSIVAANNQFIWAHAFDGTMDKVIDDLRERVHNARTTSNMTATPTVQTSLADELKKFKELLDMGAITQEEFDAKKKQLLGL